MTIQNERSDQVHSHTDQRGHGDLPTWQCRLWYKLLSPFLSHLKSGRLDITVPSGGHLVFGGDDQSGPIARMTVHRHRALWRILMRGPLGVAESYMDGDWSCEDLTTLFDLFLKNPAVFDALRTRGSLAHWVARLKHLRRANSVKGSRRNIAYHYDLGNDFYSLWLDPTMTYSSAYRYGETDTLEEAQIRKLDKALDLSGLKQGDHMLEIGCGWGALAERAALRGIDLDGLTLSTEQLEYANERAKTKGFDDKARFHLRDYRHETGTYDAIISIEMIEAVGEEHWPTYFKTLFENLRPGGRAVLQAITIDEANYERYRRSADFIQTFIFPGGMLPSVKLLHHQAEKAGLVATHAEGFALDYARTLATWRDRFLAQWSEITQLGDYDERFRRMWEYYLSYCEAGFSNGTIDVGHYVYERPAS
ncbi:cyclopropane-fatty-acyl-phospholipid synthase [Cohaesibacter sp. ES.047]|uniref:SAM-dependent methyltransferase n=1 Tax=Cohaesibacter sp. ES.047 TaxID=1798205 RepID=UPI000BB7D371|nr:cyclopropane-fatty-acyl-phospholipid synthase family protein [Cohaesibacter sp. ES.047]SNY94242.1 cyclopropane-fatty-acyl-phospholipid synthase [Cohaesibacter sp. ES.047]